MAETATKQEGLRKGRKRHFNLYLTEEEYNALEDIANYECREIRWQALKIIRDYLGLSEKTAVTTEIDPEHALGGADV